MKVQILSLLVVLLSSIAQAQKPGAPQEFKELETVLQSINKSIDVGELMLAARQDRDYLDVSPSTMSKLKTIGNTIIENELNGKYALQDFCHCSAAFAGCRAAGGDDCEKDYWNCTHLCFCAPCGWRQINSDIKKLKN